MNQLTLHATAIEVKPLRYTPSGLPAIEMLLEHESEVIEAGLGRRIQLTLPAVALGDLALMLADTPLGTDFSLKGFIAPVRKSSNRVVFHIQQADRVFAGGASAVV